MQQLTPDLRSCPQKRSTSATHFLHHGFTLVELLTTLSIIALIVGGGLLYLNIDRAGLELQSKANQIRSLLLEARSEAVAARKSISVSVPESGEEIRVLSLKSIERWGFESRNNGVVSGENGGELLVSESIEPGKGHIGKALRFRGEQQGTIESLRIPRDIEGFEIEFWMYLLQRDTHRLFGVEDSFQFVLTEEGKLGLSHKQTYKTMDSTLSKYQWYLVRLVFYGKRLMVFLNDRRSLSLNIPVRDPSTLLRDRTITIGGSESTGALLMDELQIFAVDSGKKETISFGEGILLDPPEDSGLIRFFRDGRSSSGEITIRKRGMKRSVSIQVYPSGFVRIQNQQNQ